MSTAVASGHASNAAIDAMIEAVLNARTAETFRSAVRALDRVLLSGHYLVPLFHLPGQRIAYHTCGGTYGIEEHIVANGCDASETLAAPSIGGNQEPWEYRERIGNRLALIGGMDQFNVLTRGTPDAIRAQVHRLFETVGSEGGYILSCADHFFETPPENIRAYAEAARECTY